MKNFLLAAVCAAAILSVQAVNSMDAELTSRLEAASTGEHRSDKNKARNQYRHPVETMAFFGLAPSMTILEMAPGGGWYTEVLAPAMRDTGVYIAGSYDVEVADQPKYRYKQHQALLDQIKNKPELYGQIKVATYSPPKSRDLWAADSVDMVVTFRSSHGWLGGGVLDDVYADVYKVLKPGGIFGVVQHRAPETGDAVEWAAKGYVPESRVIHAAEKAGFQLEGRSDVNANAQDLKDHEEGVWRLPPTLSLGDENREKYMAIGESDRMTLKFKKPAK